eukprot:COSAG02_NODE_46088_length_351_cov_8.111111_1_plen_86_part_01
MLASATGERPLAPAVAPDRRAGARMALVEDDVRAWCSCSCGGACAVVDTCHNDIPIPNEGRTDLSNDGGTYRPLEGTTVSMGVLPF